MVLFLNCLPRKLFNDPTSTILEDKDGKLMSAKIAANGQWHFPQSDSIPDKFKYCITYFEDQYFFKHPGFNPVSLFRALKDDIKAGRIVSGGSTITMQTIRLSRKGKSRSIYEKIIEIIMAVRLELKYSKNKILNIYCSNAPFGGNVVGLEAASWRYYGRKPKLLSWAESATLAVLPNAPSLIYPGKNHLILKAKRDNLLEKLKQNGIIDIQTCELSKSEPLPQAPFDLPRIAPHLLDRLIKDGHKGERIKTTIDLEMQERVNKLVDDYHAILSQNEVHNLAVLILDVEKNTVQSYVGNSNCPDEGSGKDVDIISSPRSTGSLLKPFLFTFMLQDGELLPTMLVPDIPTQISGYTPENFEETYDGMVPAGEALARSLNIPAVRQLYKYGLERFFIQLKKLDLHDIKRSASYYGLSIILGGSESNLWDLTNEYMKMARTLKNLTLYPSAQYISNDPIVSATEKPVFQRGALWWTMETLSTLNRPPQEAGWEEFQSSQKIAWKTGTSFGHRDAWAIGVTPRYVVGVWTGNADGEGRQGLTGLNVAAPIMFKVFQYLKHGEWFKIPNGELYATKICTKSGYLASSLCEETSIIRVPKKGLSAQICPFHQEINLNKSMQYRVSSNCYPVHEMRHKTWFVLPTVEEWYFKQKNPFYKPLPPFMKGCENENFNNMGVIYPKEYTKIFIPREITGKQGRVVFEIVHRIPNSTIYWHIDNTYIGSTKNYHRMELNPMAGIHIMTLVDERGESLTWKFELLERK